MREDSWRKQMSSTCVILSNIAASARWQWAAARLFRERKERRMQNPDTDVTDSAGPLTPLPLHALHLEHGAKMVPFAGYAMPLNYPAGILAEHRWCRSAAALFDVSHMGQVVVEGPEAGAALESLIPADLIGLEEGQARYCVLTNDAGGVRDDLIVTRRRAGIPRGRQRFPPRRRSRLHAHRRRQPLHTRSAPGTLPARNSGPGCCARPRAPGL